MVLKILPNCRGGLIIREGKVLGEVLGEVVRVESGLHLRKYMLMGGYPIKCV